MLLFFYHFNAIIPVVEILESELVKVYVKTVKVWVFLLLWCANFKFSEVDKPNFIVPEWQ